MLYLTDNLEFTIMVSMNRLPIAKRAAILGMLVEGVSLRATSRQPWDGKSLT